MEFSANRVSDTHERPTAARTAITAVATAALLQPLQPLLYRCHLFIPLVGWLWRCFSSRASRRTSTSSNSVCLRCASSARRRVFMSWFATDAGPVSSSPESTLSVRSSSSALILGNSLEALPLPPFDAARRRLSALSGSCQKQYSCGGSTVAVHLPPSRFIPAHVAIKYAPPYPSRLRARFAL